MNLHPVSFNPSSYIDENGRVFEREGRVFRGIYPEKAEFFSSLLEKPTFKDLQGNGLIVGTEISNDPVAPFPLVLEHKRIEYLSYCFEWPPPMLQDAAVLTLEICRQLQKDNLTLQDAYPYNIFFDGPNPVFVDIGSIVPVDENIFWLAYQQFCDFFLHPLFLHSAGLNRTVHFLLLDYLRGISSQELVQHLSFFQKLRIPSFLSRVSFPQFFNKILGILKVQDKLSAKNRDQWVKMDLRKPRNNFFRSLLKDVQQLNCDPEGSHWSSYYSDDRHDSKREGWTEKLNLVQGIVTRHQPRSVLDVGCNTGLYSKLAAESGARVVAVDQDIACVSNLYKMAKEQKLDILTLVVDFLNPSPQFGWNSQQFPGFLDRIQGEMVFAFALIHHFVFSSYQNFARIAQTFNRMSNKWLLVEFMPIDDAMVQIINKGNRNYDWYSLENLLEALRPYFSKVEVHDSFPQGRKMVLCEKEGVKGC